MPRRAYPEVSHYDEYPNGRPLVQGIMCGIGAGFLGGHIGVLVGIAMSGAVEQVLVTVVLFSAMAGVTGFVLANVVHPEPPTPHRPCPNCGYDLHQMATSVCPECGKPLPIVPFP